MSHEQKATEGAPKGRRGRPRKGPKASVGASASDPTKRPIKAAPWVADPYAQQIVADAAKAVDLTVEDLANLVVDSGIAALPPSDGITDSYSLRDLGTRLWGTMQQHPKDKRAEWFDGLTKTQQAAVIVTLKDRGFSSQVISEEFKVPSLTIARIWNKHADDLGAQVVGLRLNTIAGNLQLMAERAQHGAMQKQDHNAIWRIQKELTKMLQELGIVDRAIHKVEVTHRFDEQKQAELDAMLDLERKKQVQTENIKQIEATVTDGDDLPVEVRQDYDG